MLTHAQTQTELSRYGHRDDGRRCNGNAMERQCVPSGKKNQCGEANQQYNRYHSAGPKCFSNGSRKNRLRRTWTSAFPLDGHSNWSIMRFYRSYTPTNQLETRTGAANLHRMGDTIVHISFPFANYSLGKYHLGFYQSSYVYYIICILPQRIGIYSFSGYLRLR